MSLPMLVVDKSIEVSSKEQAAWKKRGLTTVRVDYMQEAIERLSKNPFLLTAINADNVTYLPLLQIMRDISTTPIFVITSNFNVQEQAEAMRHGASLYAPFQNNSDDNVTSALAHLQSISERCKQPKKLPRSVTCGNLTIFYDYHQIFCNDIEINLTPKEFDILYYFFSNPNICLTYRKISRRIWGGENEVSNNSIWQHIIKLRRKLDSAGFSGGVIRNVREVGYRFAPQYSIDS